MRSIARRIFRVRYFSQGKSGYGVGRYSPLPTTGCQFKNGARMSDFVTAAVAFCGVVAGGYLNNFIGEDYRRFRDAQALAGAVAGELSAHLATRPQLAQELQGLIDALKSGGDVVTHDKQYKSPNCPIYEANIGRIGLLDPHLSEETAYVHEQLRFFGQVYETRFRIDSEVSKVTKIAMLEYCLVCWQDVMTRGQPLTTALQRFSRAKYSSTRPWLSWLRTLG